MTQGEIDAAVAAVTGESRRTVADLGFVLLTKGPVEREPDRPPQWIDWDDVAQDRQFSCSET